MWASTAPTLEYVFKYGQNKFICWSKMAIGFKNQGNKKESILIPFLFYRQDANMCHRKGHGLVGYPENPNMELWTQCRNLVNGKILANFNLKNMISIHIKDFSWRKKRPKSARFQKNISKLPDFMISYSS